MPEDWVRHAELAGQAYAAMLAAQDVAVRCKVIGAPVNYYFLLSILNFRNWV